MITEAAYITNIAEALATDIEKADKEAREVLRLIAMIRARLSNVQMNQAKLTAALDSAREATQEALAAAREEGRLAGIAEERARWERATYKHPEDRPGI